MILDITFVGNDFLETMPTLQVLEQLVNEHNKEVEIRSATQTTQPPLFPPGTPAPPSNMSGKGTKMSLGFSAVTESTVPAHLRNDLPPGTRPGSFVALLDSDSLARTVHFAPEIDYFKKSLSKKDKSRPPASRDSLSARLVMHGNY